MVNGDDTSLAVELGKALMGLERVVEAAYELEYLGLWLMGVFGFTNKTVRSLKLTKYDWRYRLVL